MPTDKKTASSLTISTASGTAGDNISSTYVTTGSTIGTSDSFSIALPYTINDFPNDICVEPYTQRWWDYEKQYWKEYNPIIEINNYPCPKCPKENNKENKKNAKKNNKTKEKRYLPGIKRVVFNDPVTVVMWTDGTKTIVKCMEGTKFDKWTGLSMAITKKALGDDYHHTFRKHCVKMVDTFDSETEEKVEKPKKKKAIKKPPKAERGRKPERTTGRPHKKIIKRKNEVKADEE